jgi:DNA polymerase elongation subunit (family B)
MIDTLSITNILFLDVETVSGEKKFEDLNEEMQYLWRLKAAQISRIPAADLDDEACAARYSEKAAIYAEFGKIVCISVGLIVKENDEYNIRLKSFKGYDEAVLLTDFAELMTQYFNDPAKHYLCGHNLVEFDVPYICRRMVIHSVKHPTLLQLHGKKPWETKYLLDTMTLWKFGDYKHYSSLKLLTGIFGIPSPKDDIDGSQVGKVFWEEEDLDRIAIYCEKDVVAVIQILMKFKRMDIFAPEKITSLLTETN